MGDLVLQPNVRSNPGNLAYATSTPKNLPSPQSQNSVASNQPSSFSSSFSEPSEARADANPVTEYDARRLLERFEKPRQLDSTGTTLNMSLRSFQDSFSYAGEHRDEIKQLGLSLDTMGAFNRKPNGRDFLGVADLLITAMDEDEDLRQYGWLGDVLDWTVDGMKTFNEIERKSVFDFFGFETADYIRDFSERFNFNNFDPGQRREGNSNFRYEYGPIPGSQFLRGIHLRAADAKWHVRTKLGLGGWGDAARRLDVRSLEGRLKLEILTPSYLGGFLIQSGVDYRPLDHREHLFIAFAKGF